MAKCYVGTYKKYNEGNLSGKWLDLSDYPTYQDFLQACKQLHKNEHDPEFMIQDWENLPDGFPAVEWIGEQSFNDLKAAMQDEEKADLQIIDYSEKAFAVVGDTKSIKDDLKRLGGRFNPKLSCGAGWIFSKKVLDEVKKYLDCGDVQTNNATPKVEQDKALWDEYKKRVLKAWNNQESWWDYERKGTSALMMTDCGVILTFPKHKIKVDFCWSDEGPAYEEYKRLHSKEELLRNYFIEENLSHYDDIIEALTDRKDNHGEPLLPVIYENSYCGHKSSWADEVHCRREWRIREDEQDPRTRDCIHRLTENDAKKALAILKDERAKMEKRLQTYLKRYGTSKLHTWTYWADR